MLYYTNNCSNRRFLSCCVSCVSCVLSSGVVRHLQASAVITSLSICGRRVDDLSSNMEELPCVSVDVRPSACCYPGTSQQKKYRFWIGSIHLFIFLVNSVSQMERRVYTAL